MNTTDKITLRKAEARFTRAKQALDENTDPKQAARKEKAYQTAKKDLAVLRIALRSDRVPHTKPNDAVATPKTLTVKSTHKGSQKGKG